MRGSRASSVRRSVTVRERGAQTSEDADMSSDKPGENPGRRKPKVSHGHVRRPGVSRDLR